MFLTLHVSIYTLFSMSLFINYPSWISPVVASWLPIRWYGLMYIFAFATAYVICHYQVKKQQLVKMSIDDLQLMFIYTIVGLLVGARLFSVLFYSDGWYYITHFWLIFWPFRNGQFVGLPGMSYHGGVVGAAVGVLLFSKRKDQKHSFWTFADLLCLGIPLGYTFGRLGNFLNAELFGRISTSPIAMVFPDAEKFSTNLEWVRNFADQIGMEYVLGQSINLPRHPSQLYEMIFEGIVLFLIIYFIVKPWVVKKNKAPGTVFSFYLLGYGVFRFIIEYFRQPDSDIGYLIGKSDNIYIFESIFNISQGQIFCLLMIIAGITMYIYRNAVYKKELAKIAEEAAKKEERKAKKQANKGKNKK